MPAGEETLRDIEKKAAGEVSSLFGDKSRKIAILAESPFGSIWPTDALQNKFLPALRQIFQMLGLEPLELPLGTRGEVWHHPRLVGRKHRPEHYFGEMFGD